MSSTTTPRGSHSFSIETESLYKKLTSEINKQITASTLGTHDSSRMSDPVSLQRQIRLLILENMSLREQLEHKDSVLKDSNEQIAELQNRIITLNMELMNHQTASQQNAASNHNPSNHEANNSAQIHQDEAYELVDGFEDANMDNKDMDNLYMEEEDSEDQDDDDSNEDKSNELFRSFFSLNYCFISAVLVI